MRPVDLVAVIGAGRMGLPVCAALARAGFTVTASDRDPARRTDVEAAGARWAATAAGAVEAAETLITVLPGSPELEAVMNELLPAMPPGTSWVDLTSASPRVGEQLRALAGARQCLDAPMGGGPEAARAGELELFVGGNTESVERHRPILEALGKLHHVGGPGAGHLVKLLVNLLWFGQAVAVGEALLLAKASGLDLETVRGALQESAADSRFIRVDTPRLLNGDYLTSFGLDRCVEELEALGELAATRELPFELSTLVRDLHDRALERFGPREGELLAVAMLEQDAGLPLRRADG